MRSYTQVWGLGLRLIFGGEWSTIQPTTPTIYLLANLYFPGNPICDTTGLLMILHSRPTVIVPQSFMANS